MKRNVYILLIISLLSCLISAMETNKNELVSFNDLPDEVQLPILLLVATSDQPTKSLNSLKNVMLASKHLKALCCDEKLIEAIVQCWVINNPGDVEKLYMSTAKGNSSKNSGNATLFFKALRKLGMKFDQRARDIALFNAVSHGQQDIVHMLLEDGANPSVGLFSAKGNQAIIAQLLDANALGFSQDAGAFQLLSVILPKPEAMQQVLNYGFFCHRGKGLTSDSIIYELLSATLLNNQEVVKCLIDQSIDVNSQDNSNTTPLMFACANNYYDLAEFLIIQGAVVNHKNSCGATPLILAACEGHDRIVELLCKYGAIDAQDCHGKTALCHAASKGYAHIVELLLLSPSWFRNCNLPPNEMLVAKKEYINKRDIFGNTPLMWAAMGGHCEVVKILMNKYTSNALFDLVNKELCTALILAARNGHVSVVDLLIQHKADIDVQDMGGNTALMVAAKNGHMLVVELLAERGADLEVKNRHEATALMLASSKQIAKCLIDHGAHSKELELHNADGFLASWRARYNKLVRESLG